MNSEEFRATGGILATPSILRDLLAQHDIPPDVQLALRHAAKNAPKRPGSETCHQMFVAMLQEQGVKHLQLAVFYMCHRKFDRLNAWKGINAAKHKKVLKKWGR